MLPASDPCHSLCSGGLLLPLAQYTGFPSLSARLLKFTSAQNPPLAPNKRRAKLKVLGGPTKPSTTQLLRLLLSGTLHRTPCPTSPTPSSFQPTAGPAPNVLTDSQPRASAHALPGIGQAVSLQQIPIHLSALCDTPCPPAPSSLNPP